MKTPPAASLLAIGVPYHVSGTDSSRHQLPPCDTSGNMVSYTSRAGGVRTASFDDRNRKTSATCSDGTPGKVDGWSLAQERGAPGNAAQNYANGLNPNACYKDYENEIEKCPCVRVKICESKGRGMCREP